MPEDSREIDAEIIAAAYAERVREAFRAFADNIGMGQNEKASTDRFMRSLDLIRKARDIALDVVRAAPVGGGRGTAPAAGTGGGVPEIAGDGLSPEVREMIEHAVEQTQGVRKLV